MTRPESDPTSATTWLFRMPGVFADQHREILTMLGWQSMKRLGADYHLVKGGGLPLSDQPAGRLFVSWNLPVEHSWPCCPQEVEGFIEKAAQALWKKFGPRHPCSVLVGPLNPDPSQAYYRSLASNLRGRLLQLFGKEAAGQAAEGSPDSKTLFCLVGKEGLFAGIRTPRAANGFYPGGTRFIRQEGENTISRAGAKIAEALYYLELHHPALEKGSHWLELGASPGGMTSELLNRGFTVSAVDRAPLDTRVMRRGKVHFHQADVAEFVPAPGDRFDAILSDLNGPAVDSMRQVVRLSAFLRPGGLVVFTLKTLANPSVVEMLRLRDAVATLAEKGRLQMLAETHLTYNRHEFTQFFVKRR